MLPLTRSDSMGGPGSKKGWFFEYLRRIVHYPQMDLDYSFWQMIYLCIAPSRVYRTTRYHKQTKNQWARDDPAFTVILMYFLIMAAIAYSVAFRVSGVFKFVKLVLYIVGVEFIGFGSLTATFCWWLSNKYLRVPVPHSVEQKVEWLYAFDIHCNSFFPLFILLYIVQFFIIHILIPSDNFVSALLSNLLYAIGLSYYYYITFLGYSILPFLQNTVFFLYPVGAIGLLFIVSLIFRFNACQFVMSIYFS
mmetsp:Transcript_40912/g.66352  ORF Transcript_40912/g.66352 Transcript_40912/m.66352 type:complete len:249 (-) Transcript_40912:39-785(-)